MSSFAITWAPLVFGFALFLSSGLLFIVQPMIGKSLLPQLGGGPLAWSVCLVFFQATLLAGYIYADLLHRFRGVRWQPWLQTALFGLAVLLCFAGLFGDDMLNHLLPRLTSLDDWPIVSTFAVLIVTIGLPYFALAAVGPLVQRWFAHLDHPRASDPYFLFVASNLGGLSALVIYVALIDGHAPLAAQWMSWKLAMTALGLLVLLTAFCVWRSPRNPELEPPDPNDPNAPLIPKLIGRGEATWPRRLYWCGAAALPTGMLLGVTDLLTLDLAPVPTLWSLPLAVYLLAFGQAFGRWAPYEMATPGRRIAAQVVYAALLSFAVGLFLLALIDNHGERMEFGYGVLFLMMFFIPSSWLSLLQPLATLLVVFIHANIFRPTTFGSGIVMLHLMCFYLSARLCLGLLAKDRPAAPALTTYYTWIALGGLAGGLFQLLLAPLIFRVAFLESFFLAALAGTLRPAWSTNGTTDWLICSWYTQKKDPEATMRIRMRIARVFDVLLAMLVAGMAIVLFCWRSQVEPAPERGAWFWMTLRSLAADVPLLIALVAVLLMLARPLRFGLALAAVVVVSMIGLDGPLARQRTSFGIVRVTETRIPLVPLNPLGVNVDVPFRTERTLTNSTSLHGVCVTWPPIMDRYATMHHHRRGPVGQVMHRLSWFAPPRQEAQRKARGHKLDHGLWLQEGRDNTIGDARLAASLFGFAAAPLPMATNLDIAALWTEPPYAMVGLGVGSLYTYAHPGQWVDAYELDPAIIKFSTDDPPLFHYFQSAQARGVQGKIFAGDARRNLSKPGREGFYHVIFVDAFNSHAIPTHLLTIQAIQTYLQKLAPDGLICINITNPHLDLRHMLDRLAQDNRLELARRVAQAPEHGELPAYAPSTWYLLARSEDAMRKWERRVAPFVKHGEVNQRFARNEPWTDDAVNLFAAAHDRAGWPALIHWMLGLCLLVGALLALVEILVVTQNRSRLK